MLNIIASDLFRVRKGKTFIGVTIGIVALVVLIAAIFGIMNTPGVYDGLMSQSGLINAGDAQDMTDMIAIMPKNGGEFVNMFFAEGADIFALLLLPFVITVIGADYSTGAFRNLLSYHSKRSSIYIAKAVTTFLLTMVSAVLYAVLTCLSGGLVFGFSGFSLALFGQVVKGLLFMMPIVAGLTALGYCLMVVLKKTSYTIAAYLVGMIVWTMVLQIFAMLIPGMNWLMQLDLMSALGIAAEVAAGTAASSSLMIPMIFSVVLLVGCTVFGIYRYKTTDFDFS